MSCFKRFYKKEEKVSTTFDIDEEMYTELERLSNEVYEASINKLVNAAIENLIETENITLYKKNPNKSYVSRSFLIRNSFLDELYELKKKYRISIRLLVNVAIKNALNSEENSENFKKDEKDYQCKIK